MSDQNNPVPENTAQTQNATDASAMKILQQQNQLLTSFANDYRQEQKSQRRWRWIRRLLFIAVIAIILFASRIQDPVNSVPHTAIVSLTGIIGPDTIDSDRVLDSLANAFAAQNAKGVILHINSPGGSPVQSAYMNEEIRYLRAQYPDKPFYVVVGDIGASGGYYVAVAADEIYAHPSSLIGSIGVMINGFGFVDAMNKLGVERRLVTAGSNKAILDPFSVESEEEKRHVKDMLVEIHDQFIATVKQGRGDRLANDPDIFSGLFWSGEGAKALGLIDGFYNARQVARDKIQASTLIDYSYQLTLLEQFNEEVGMAVEKGLTSFLLQPKLQ